MKKNLILAAIALTSTIGFAAGNTATANAVATAKIRKAIAITKNADLDFAGIVITGAGTSDTATVPANGAFTFTTGGGVISTTFNTAAPASFGVTGTKNATYVVTVPSTPVTLTGSNGGITLDATAFTFYSLANASGLTGKLSAGGIDTLTVGATLTVLGTTTDGDFLSGSFPVTVAYN